MLPFYNESDLKTKVFVYLLKLLGHADQLRINHWETTIFAEHKMTDELVGNLHDLIDKLAEATMGIYGRPQINMITNQICDIKLCNTKTILDDIINLTNDINKELQKTENEDLKNIVADIFETTNKSKYLITLE